MKLISHGKILNFENIFMILFSSSLGPTSTVIIFVWKIIAIVSRFTNISTLVTEYYSFFSFGFICLQCIVCQKERERERYVTFEPLGLLWNENAEGIFCAVEEIASLRLFRGWVALTTNHQVSVEKCEEMLDPGYFSSMVEIVLMIDRYASHWIPDSFAVAVCCSLLTKTPIRM